MRTDEWTDTTSFMGSFYVLCTNNTQEDIVIPPLTEIGYSWWQLPFSISCDECE